MTAEEITQAAWVALGAKAPCLVVLTGGEPLRQSVGALCKALLDAGFPHIQFETAGNLWDPTLTPLFTADAKVSLVCSPKTSHLHPMIAKLCQHYKYVVKAGDSDPDDGLPVAPTQANGGGRPARPWDFAQGFDSQWPLTVWVSPCDEHSVEGPEQNKKNLAWATALTLHHGYRLSLQVHKLVNVP